MFLRFLHYRQGLPLTGFVICLNYQAVSYIYVHKLAVTIIFTTVHIVTIIVTANLWDCMYNIAW
jgi:uncharacterized membrane protein